VANRGRKIFGRLTLLAFLFLRLSSATEVRSPEQVSALQRTMKSFFGVGRSHRVVLKLSSLFALDSFGVVLCFRASRRIGSTFVLV
jgi:hypothetical protein